MVSVSKSRSRDGLETYQRLVSRKIVNVSVSSRSREADVSVSAIYFSCPRPIFGQIVQANSTQCERALNVEGAYDVVTIAHHINTLETMNVKDNI